MAKNLFDLKDNVSIVTGGGQGIGKTLAIGLAMQGSDVIIADISFGNALATSKEIENLGRKSKAIKCDVSSSKDVKNMVKSVLDEFNHVDILINCAGISKKSFVIDMEDKDWNEVISINLRGVFLCCREVVKLMIKQKKGRIINITSVMGKVGRLGSAHYSASKAGINALTKALALEVAKYGITVNAIAPCSIDSPLLKPLIEKKLINIDEIIQRNPIGRLGKLEELVGPAIFLASEASSLVTGHILNVDGGFSSGYRVSYKSGEMRIDPDKIKI